MKNHGGQAAGILLAGGKGSRARFSGNKAYIDVVGAPMISHSLRTLDRSPWVVELVLVIRPQDRQLAEKVVEQSGISTPWKMVSGGASRHRSEFRGLEALSDRIRNGRLDLVAIHDGARPFLSESLLEELFRLANRHGGAVPTMTMESPAFGVSERGDLMGLTGDRLHRAQTPQVFWASELLAAYHLAREAGFEGVDTAETVERFSDLKMRAVPGDPANLKLTFPEDFQAQNI